MRDFGGSFFDFLFLDCCGVCYGLMLLLLLVLWVERYGINLLLMSIVFVFGCGVFLMCEEDVDEDVFRGGVKK